MSVKERGINPIIAQFATNDIDAFYAQELKRVLADQTLLNELAKRGITQEMVNGNLGNILDFERTHLECDTFHHIHGDKPCNTQLVELAYENGRIIRKLGQCHHQIKLDQMRLRYLFADFPASWINNRIKNIDTQRTRAPLLQELLNLIKGDKHWLYVYGRSGRGKTYMVVSALNELVEKNPEMSFAVIDFPQFVSENMVDYFANRAQVDYLVTALSNVDYLVINKFGNEELNEMVRNAITMPLLSNRDSNGKVTIILSTLSLEELESLHKSGKNNQVRARQLVETIKDNIKSPIELGGAKVY